MPLRKVKQCVEMEYYTELCLDAYDRQEIQEAANKGTQTMTGHTKGPWLICRGADGYPIICTAPDSFSPSGQGIAHVCKRPMSQDHEANARLIACAPDMLGALKRFCAAMDMHLGHSHELAICEADNLARAIISKAEGK